MGTYLIYMISPVIVYILFVLIYQKPVGESEKLNRRYLFVCSIIVFAMIACMHYSVGSGDAKWYYDNWRYMRNISPERLFYVIDKIDMEKGYLISVWGLSHIFRHPQFVFVVYGLLVAISLRRFLFLNCSNTILGLVMFNCLGLWGFMLQGLRQGIAMGICLFAIEYCKQRKLLKFVLVVFFATTFHASAIVFLIMYLLPCFEMNGKGYFLVGVGTIIGFTQIDKIFEMINYIINDTYTTNATDQTGGGFVSLAIYCLIIIAMLFFYSGREVNIEIRMFFYMLVCGFVIFAMRYSVNTITQRIAYFFMFSQIPTLSLVIQNLKKRDRSIATFIVICLCLGITVYKAKYSVLVPYVFFWQI